MNQNASPEERKQSSILECAAARYLEVLKVGDLCQHFGRAPSTRPCPYASLHACLKKSSLNSSGHDFTLSMQWQSRKYRDLRTLWRVMMSLAEEKRSTTLACRSDEKDLARLCAVIG